ncbi:hypothetical protein E2C01_063456 [Portunus trituberculatus]|uniref:Uncharacterized protein n=1 Tax=Portunus trituberculatus TaxID=210409 RepID=A0A5B7HAI7_PORTR|nr:hypothetical protein [Portunus trituberculatus]
MTFADTADDTFTPVTHSLKAAGDGRSDAPRHPPPSPPPSLPSPTPPNSTFLIVIAAVTSSAPTTCHDTAHFEPRHSPPLRI